MYTGIIIWVSVGDVGQLKDSISSYIVIPICSAFEKHSFEVCVGLRCPGQHSG